VDHYYFMKHLLDWLAKPGHFNRMMAVTMRVVGVMVVPFSLVSFFKAGKVIFDLPASEILGGILFQMFYVVAIYCVVHGFFIRAREIDALPGGEYNMFPLAAIMARVATETMAAFIALVSVGGGIFVWFTGKGIGAILDPLPGILPVFGGTNFMGGIQFMAGGLLSAILLLVAGYLLAEGLGLIARAASRLPEPHSKETPEPVLEEPSFRRRSGTGN
jgi:hypothetical protein